MVDPFRQALSMPAAAEVTEAGKGSRAGTNGVPALEAVMPPCESGTVASTGCPRV